MKRTRSGGKQSPGEIKRREVSWTLMKKVRVSFAGLGEIKRREVSWTLKKKLVQKRSRAGRWCWARERELDFFCFSCFPTAELRTSSL